jgi:hypothetical protein
MRKIIRALGLAIAHRIGARITDHRTGKSLGRAIIIPWRGRIHIVGLQVAVIPVFLAQKRLTYWKQELAFTTHPPPDFPGGIENTPETDPPTREH